MSEEKTVVWITKNARTTGIQAVEAEIYDSRMVSYASNGFTLYAHGNNWHRTPEKAIAKAEEMRAAKLASLKKSIAKIKALKFTATDA